VYLNTDKEHRLILVDSSISSCEKFLSNNRSEQIQYTYLKRIQIMTESWFESKLFNGMAPDDRNTINLFNWWKFIPHLR